MSDSSPIHPPEQELVAFGLGTLPPDDTHRVEQHLESCPDCCETMLGLKDDTFIELVRAARPATAANLGPEATLDVALGAVTRSASGAALPAELRQHARYEILGLLGRGGMGDVYKAQHKVMNRPVALKVIKPELIENEAARQRFHREVQAAARLHDRNIVTAYDAEQAGGLHFLVMEFVDGVNLDEVVRERGPLPVAQACDYVRQAAAGLQHAHELGMVHRDIKPHNLMLANTGEVKILDFGLANFASELATEDANSQLTGTVLTAEQHQLTHMGSMMGTPDYIAPEQAVDAHAADIRADIYSLGCTFYTLLAGRTPFAQRTVLDKIKAHAEEKAEPLSKHRDDVPQEVEAILLKMMAKNPADRYATPAELIEALDRLIEQRVEEKLRERGLGKSPPLNPLAPAGNDEASKWYDRLAGFMWSVACINLLGGIIMAGVIAWVLIAGGIYYHLFILHPLTLLVLFSAVPGALLLAAVPRVRRMESYSWTLFAAFLCLLPTVGSVLGFVVGCVALVYLLRSEYRVPLGAALRPSFREELMFVAMLLCPFAVTAAGVVFYIQTDVGIVRVEVADESLKVRIDGQTITAQDRDTTVLRIRPGDRRLIITSKNFFDNDFEFQTDSFQLRRGDKVALTVDIIGGEVVVHRDGKRFDSQSFGRKTEPAQRKSMPLLAELAGHTNVVRAVRFLPGNERLVSVDGNGNVIVWDAKAKRSVRRFKVPGETYTDADVSADGRLLAVGSDWGPTKGRMEIWDLEKGAVLHRLTHRFNNIEQLRLSPDGDKLVAVGEPPVAVVWDVADGKELLSITESGMKSCAFSPDGQHVAIGSAGRVNVFDVKNGSLKRKIELSPAHTIPDLAFTTNGSQLIAILSGGPIALIDAKLWSVNKMLPNASTAQLLRSGAFVNDELIVTGTDQGFLHLRKLDGAVEATAQCGAGSCLHVSVSSDSRQVVTAGGWLYDKTTRQWTVTSDFKLRLWQLPERVLSEGAGGPPKLIEDMRLEGHEDFVLALEYTPDGSRVISGGAHHVLVANARNSRRERELVGHTRTVHALDVSPDGKSVVAAGKGDEILAWDFATGNIIQRFTGHTGFVECVAFSPDGRRIASGSSNWVRKESDLTIRMWDVASGRQLWQAAAPPVLKGQGQVFEVLFTPDGRRLVTVHHGPHDGVSVWDVETGDLERRFSGSHSSIKCADLSPDGRILATGHEAVEIRERAWDDSENAVIRLWDFETGREIGQLAGHTGGLQSVKFSSDGQQLVSCSGGQFLHDAFRPQPSRDNTVRVWDVASRRELFRQPLEKQGQAAVFSPDGRFIASSAGVFNEKPLVQIWRLPERVEPKPPLTIGMNDEFGMLFEGRLVAPAELSRRLGEALKDNPDREVAIDLPKRPWTVAPHVDQLEQIARTAGAKSIARPAWSQIRIVFGVDKSGQQTLDIEGPGFSSTGLMKDHLPTAKEVIAKNPTLPVLIAISEDIRISDPKFTLGMAQVNSAAETAGAKVRVIRTRRATESTPPHRNDQSIADPAAAILGDWTETNDPQRGPVHTLKFLKNGEFHEAGPMVISLDGGPKEWVTKDLDGDGKPDIIPFQMSGSWELKDGHLLTETTSSNVLGFKNERPGNQRRFKIETLTKEKLVLVLIEEGKETERFTAFRPTSPAAKVEAPAARPSR